MNSKLSILINEKLAEDDMKLINARINSHFRGTMIKTKINLKNNERYSMDLSMDSQFHIICYFEGRGKS